jgi:hypothetical protein
MKKILVFLSVLASTAVFATEETKNKKEEDKPVIEKTIELEETELVQIPTEE